MKTKFQHREDIRQLNDNAVDDVRDARAAIFALTHAPLNEYVKETRYALLASISGPTPI